MRKYISRPLETCLVIAAGLLVIWYFKRHPYLLWAAGGVVVCGFIPPVAKAIDWGWYKLAEGMGWVMSKIILSAFFFLFLVPLSLSRKLFSSNDLMQSKKGKDTYWVERNHTYTKEDLENPW